MPQPDESPPGASPDPGSAPWPAPWPDPITVLAMTAARDRHLARGGDVEDAVHAAREIILARHPALPLRMIGEAVDGLPWRS